MKKLFIFLFVVVVFFAIIGCPRDNDSVTSTTSTVISKSFTGEDNAAPTLGDTNNTAPTLEDTNNTAPISSDTANPSQVPEPATMFLIGSGLVGLAVIGRKRFKK